MSSPRDNRIVPRTRGFPDPVKGDINELNCEPVTLDVRGRPFFTTIGTLVQRNHFFAVFLSGRWKVPKAEDGSIFVDSDPDVFSHILTFLSRGVFPIAYNPGTGHDHKLYADILAQARYFSVPELECWLENACYRKAVSLVVTTERMDELGPNTDRIDKRYDTAQVMKWKTVETPTWHPPPNNLVRTTGPPPEGRYSSVKKTWFVIIRKEVRFDRNWGTTTGTCWEQFWAGNRRK
ncbi:hypothetical protein CONLIGDRAFT_627021 [Coniochaeta ligniaria NRRL 30616]|uniref:Potassium channel tetramerisation-type BTB domain-containing protein n=1 Tax=Coniochaeta ligniaria NRRL 30616 TaxID=1408157 RepID=A0A1J7JNK9_9PEZI|nr:hypothetical protein CONLIGDRAFT_627021 [Coniochaeta ligniaria NRRL 30616]